MLYERVYDMPFVNTSSDRGTTALIAEHLYYLVIELVGISVLTDTVKDLGCN